MKPPPLLLTLGFLNMGGAERQALYLVEGLRKDGRYTPVVLAFEEDGPVADRLRGMGVEVHTTDPAFQPPWRLASWLWKTRRFLKGLAPAAVIAYTARPNVLMGMATRTLGGCPFVWNQRDEGRWLKGGVMERVAIGGAAAVITNASHSAATLRQLYRDLPPVAVIHNGILPHAPAVDRSEMRRRLDLAPEDLLVTMVANLHPAKDHLTVVRAWKQVLDAAPGRRGVLMLAGRHQHTAEEVAGEVAALGVSDSVRMTGAVEDVASLLGASDLLVHSTRREGMPNAILEGMMAGLPVIATDIAGNREALGTAGGGALFPVGDVAALAALMGRLMESPELRREWGAANHARADTEFSMDRMVSETLALVDRVAKGV
ncbi:MAG: glycosyltransferase [Candidatus Sumerlaeia bacterium]|nr:glycosyltransferase [Candidatus Sumerlaeia bacterium]